MFSNLLKLINYYTEKKYNKKTNFISFVLSSHSFTGLEGLGCILEVLSLYETNKHLKDNVFMSLTQLLIYFHPKIFLTL
jgi:hypothetical protein